MTTNSLLGTWTAFIGRRCVASGPPADVALRAKAALVGEPRAALLVFDDETSDPVELDLRGSAENVAARFRKESLPEDGKKGGLYPRGPGRPKLGVTGREVTLLPRHWEWLDEQPGGASVTLRKLVEEAKRARAGDDKARKSREAAYKFMSAMAGNEPGFEEAIRAVFSTSADRRRQFEKLVKSWPADIRAHALKLFERTVTPL